MHVDFITIGARHDVNRFIEELNAKCVPYGEYNHNGEVMNMNAQILVRPVQLWDVVFPDKAKDVVLNTIFGDVEGKVCLHESSLPNKFSKYLWILKKALGLNTLPDYDKSKILNVHKKNTHTIALGVREDRKDDKGNELL